MTTRQTSQSPSEWPPLKREIAKSSTPPTEPGSIFAIGQPGGNQAQYPKAAIDVYREILGEVIFAAKGLLEGSEGDEDQDPVERLKISIGEFCKHHPETDPADFRDYPPLTKNRRTPRLGIH